jgi:hypothetical protein
MISGAEALGWPYVALVVGFNSESSNESSGGGAIERQRTGKDAWMFVAFVALSQQALNKRSTSAVN